jgi:predicted nucleotidyltransferase
MDLTNPTRALAPTIDLQLLTILAGVSGEMSGSEISRLATTVTSRGVFKALKRLETEGLVQVRTASRLNFYSFNRDHVAAGAVIAAMGFRQKLFERIGGKVKSWKIQPISLAIFGSAARGDGTPESDIDVLVVRSNNIDEDSLVWENQIHELSLSIYKWSGNHASVIQANEKEIAQMVKSKNPIVNSLARDAYYLVGSDLIANKTK